MRRDRLLFGKLQGEDAHLVGVVRGLAACHDRRFRPSGILPTRPPAFFSPQLLWGATSEHAKSVRLSLVRRGPSPRRLQAGGLRQGHSALHGAPTARLRAGGHQGRRARGAWGAHRAGAQSGAVPAPQGRTELLQHLPPRHAPARGRPGQHRPEPSTLTCRRSRPACATSSSASSSPPRSIGSPRPGCSIR